MTERMADPVSELVVFKNPPVVETALSIQFDELSGFRAIHFGLYFETVREEFPTASDQPRLGAIDPRLPRQRVAGHPLVQLQHAVPLQRVWYESKSELIQLQPDRFAFNWRKSAADDAYPSYASNGPRCLERFSKFERFCSEQSLGPIRPNLIEVVYINHILSKAGERAVDLFPMVFTGLQWTHSDTFLPHQPESATLNRVYVIGKDRGLLYVEATPAKTSVGQEMILLQITARIRHDEGGGDKVSDSMGLAHEWVVNGFKSATNTRFQKERWGATI
jgi:uncharacterized protein (TIGR04255 family)